MTQGCVPATRRPPPAVATADLVVEAPPDCRRREGPVYCPACCRPCWPSPEWGSWRRH